MKYQTILSALRKASEAGRRRQAEAFERRLVEMWKRRRRRESFCSAKIDRVIAAVKGGVSVSEACAKEDAPENAVWHEIRRRGGLRSLRPILYAAGQRLEGTPTREGLRLVRDGMDVASAATASGATLAALRSALARRGGVTAFRENNSGEQC